MRKFRYPDEENGDIVYKEITEQEILDKFHDMHHKVLTELGRENESSKDKTIEFFIMTHLAQEVK